MSLHSLFEKIFNSINRKQIAKKKQILETKSKCKHEKLLTRNRYVIRQLRKSLKPFIIRKDNNKETLINLELKGISFSFHSTIY